MNYYYAIVVFTLVWWMVFMMALPIGIKKPSKVKKGHMNGAPLHPHLKKKAFWTTIITIIFTNIYLLIVNK